MAYHQDEFEVIREFADLGPSFGYVCQRLDPEGRSPPAPKPPPRRASWVPCGALLRSLSTPAGSSAKSPNSWPNAMPWSSVLGRPSIVLNRPKSKPDPKAGPRTPQSYALATISRLSTLKPRVDSLFEYCSRNSWRGRLKTGAGAAVDSTRSGKRGWSE